MTTTGPESQAAVTAIVAEIVGPDRLQAIKDTFAAIDKNQDGKLELTEFLDYLLEQERTRLVKRFAYCDADGDGAIDFEEFLFASIPSARILRAFQAFDADGDGLLSFEEITKLSETLVLPLEGKQLADLLEKADLDGDLKLTFHELYGLISHYGFQ